MRKTKIQLIDEMIPKMSDSEKIKTLYRMEITDLNRKVSGIFNYIKYPMDSFSQLRVNLMHTFYDGTNSQSFAYKELESFMTQNSVSVCDYFNSNTMFAFASFLFKLCDTFQSTGNYEKAKDVAYNYISQNFSRSNFGLNEKPAITQSLNLTKDQRMYFEKELVKSLNITNLYTDATYKTLQDKSNLIEGTDITMEEYYKECELWEKEKLEKEAEQERRYDPDYYFEEYDDDGKLL